MAVRSLHVITSTARRGAETFATDLVRELNTGDHKARVVALHPSVTGQTHDVPVLGASRRSPATLAKLRRAAKKADIVVAHGSSTLEACAIGLAGSGVPFVYRTIGDPSYWVTSGTRRRRVSLMLRCAAGNVVLWQGAAGQLDSGYDIPPDRLTVIPNAVPHLRFPFAGAAQRREAREHFGISPAIPCVGYVGALSSEKDVAAVIAAAVDIDDAVALIAGDGPQRGQLQHHAEGFPAGKFRFLGAVSEPQLVYAAVDLLLLPSLSEGMPAVLIEAGLMGTATVASAVGAIPEMIDDGVTGFLAEPGDHAAFSRTVAHALPTATEVGARAATAFRDRYTMAQVAIAWSELLTDIAASAIEIRLRDGAGR